MKYLVFFMCFLLFVGCTQKPNKEDIVIPTEVATPTATINNSSTAVPTPTPIRLEKPYKMNKNYDIVPKDPSYPSNIVLLTIDDGPKKLADNQAMIDILNKHDAKAIFFLNGYLIKRNPEIVKLLVDNGQVIGNHSYDHIDLKKEDNASIDYQIDEVQRQVKEITNEYPAFFRPPFGSKNDYVHEKAIASNMLLMTWSNGSLDWTMTMKNNDYTNVIDEVIKQLRNGSNILMHELPWTIEALDQLLTELELLGFTFVDPNDIDTKLDPFAINN
jgi:peptidoglycan/xylan/chitin deacetylase (PgdA/CDA1 family)